jgi:DNA-binding MarR family transcriptional regulator
MEARSSFHVEGVSKADIAYGIGYSTRFVDKSVNVLTQRGYLRKEPSEQRKSFLKFTLVVPGRAISAQPKKEKSKWLEENRQILRMVRRISRKLSRGQQLTLSEESLATRISRT